MSFRCMLGKHSYGVPRTNGDGTVSSECMVCLRVETSSIRLQSADGADAALDARRAQAIADLVAQERWVGIPSNPPDMPKLAPVPAREQDGGGVLVPHPQAA
jgi:hypothetical protein